VPTVIYTETSKYILDRGAKTISRVPGKGQGNVAGLRPTKTTTLRRDTETIKLLSMETCEIGKPMEMFVIIREDGIATYRRTTIVRSIVDDN